MCEVDNNLQLGKYGLENKIMIILLIFVFIHGIQIQIESKELLDVDHLPNLAAFEDAEHRGPRWYHSGSELTDSESGSDTSDFMYSSSISDEVDSSPESLSSQASSFESREKRIVTRVYRQCQPCPHDMLKKRNNAGIKWICGGYQRARRSFKSICMMRYRNCEDGTMFVKFSDHRCKNDSYHGKHWFYDYRV